MNLQKYSYLFEIIPSLKNIIEKKRLSFNEKKCLNLLYRFYIQKINNDLSLKDKKKLLRNKFKDIREDYSLKKLERKSLILNKRVINSIEFNKANIIFCYISFGKEIDTFFLLNHILSLGKILCVPLIRGTDIIACKITSLSGLKKNKFDILEPIKLDEIKKNDIDLIIVPGLGFNSLGFRIGYGGGFYDKYLAGYNGISIGLVLKDFICDNFIPESNDQPVNKLFIQ